jgi:AraC family transcriptional regulator
VIVFLHAGSFRANSSAAIGLLDCTRVGFFNAGVPFQSAHPYGGGDAGSDLALREDVLTEMLARHDAKSSDRPERPFPSGSGPCAPETFLLHRLLLRKVSAQAHPDELEVEELALLLADRVIAASFGGGSLPEEGRRRRENDEADEIRGYLSARPGRRHRLDEIASALGSSPFRLCRSFRAATGTTIHRYLTQIRIHRAIDRLAGGCHDITGLALDLGFSSHSHFTAAFRKNLGTTPEKIRRAAGARPLPLLRLPLSRPAAAAR